jgi:hypothetical protein
MVTVFSMSASFQSVVSPLFANTLLLAEWLEQSLCNCIELGSELAVMLILHIMSLLGSSCARRSDNEGNEA